MRSARAALPACVGIVLVPLLATSLLSDSWINVATTAVVAAIVAAALGVVTERAGMLVLCAMSFAAIGAWVVSWMHDAGAPGGFYLWCLLGGLAAVPVGMALALPALRLRGVNLAVLTLSFGVMLDEILQAKGFPGADTLIPVERPSAVSGEHAYFLLVWGVFVVVVIGLALVDRTRMGASWRAIANSERATAATGRHVGRSKLAAFALAAGIAGLAGGLLVGQNGSAVAQNFGPAQSLAILALAVTAGARWPEGALLAGVLSAFIPQLFTEIGIAQSWSMVLFAVATIASLSAGMSAAGAVRARLRWLSGRRRRPPADDVREAPSLARATAQGLDVRDLTVRYGHVVAVDGVSLTVPPGTIVGLIGPNGAGKTTTIDAVSGFLSGYAGAVTLGDRPLDDLRVDERARAGLRRTFQQDRVPPELSVAAYVRMASGRSLADRDVSGLLSLFDGPALDARIAEIDLRERRLVEIVGAVAASPSILLLDEPAAGLTADESRQLGDQLTRVSELLGCAILLVEHDIELVSAICASVTVLDFGRVIATGPPGPTLADPVVVDAYLGKEMATT